MAGLIYKEINMMRSQMKSWIWAFGIMVIYAVMFRTTTVMISCIAVIGLINCLSTFTYDRVYRCDAYIAAMPVSRKKMVISKYLFLLILDIAMTLLAAAVSMVLQILLKDNPWELLASLGGVLGATLFLQAVTLPCIYAFGPEKARIAVVSLGFIPLLIVMFLNSIGVMPNEAFIMGAIAALPFILAGIILASLLISISIYCKKDIT